MKKMVGLMCMVAALGLVLAGCGKKEKPAPPRPPKPVTHTAKPATPAPAAPAKEKTAQQTAEQAAGQAQQAAAKVAEQVTVEQTTCPVVAGPINKEIFVEYKGKKVYFCCADCKAAFEKDPEKYVKDLPQFKP